MYLLDTDHVVILQTKASGDYERLIERMNLTPASELFVSIITFHEQMLGWNTYISRAKDLAGVVRGYRKLHDLFEYFHDAQVLLFDDNAAKEFGELKKSKVRVATMDLRIASIALSKELVVLTRNQQDFTRITNLKLEDWTK